MISPLSMLLQGGAVVPQSVLTLFDVIGVLGTVVSLVLSLVAIWLAMNHKRDADRVNSDTSHLLTDIRSETKAISQGVMEELRAYGNSMRGSFSANHMTTPSSITGMAPGLEYRDQSTEGGESKT